MGKGRKKSAKAQGQLRTEDKIKTVPAGERVLTLRMHLLMLDEKTHDVTFVVGQILTYALRKRNGSASSVLAAASESFKEMFSGEFERPCVISAPEDSPEAFRVMLEYVYTDQATLASDNFFAVLFISHEYLLTNLYKRAIEFAGQLLDASNVLHYLQKSGMFRELREKCLGVIDENADAVLKSEEFLVLDDALLSEILVRDTLVVKEIIVFNRAVDWASKHLERQRTRMQKKTTPAELRRILGKNFNLIRFPIMSGKDFCDGPDKSGILSTKELLALYRWFAAAETPGKFSTRKRAGSNPCELHPTYCDGCGMIHVGLHPACKGHAAHVVCTFATRIRLALSVFTCMALTPPQSVISLSLSMRCINILTIHYAVSTMWSQHQIM